MTVNPSSYRNDYSSTPSLLNLNAQNTVPVAGIAVTTAAPDETQDVELVSPALAQMLAANLSGTSQQVVLGVKLYGHTLDGAAVDTGEYYFPLNVCDGCLPLPACTGTAVDTATNCFGPSQDSPDVCQ